MFLSEKGYCLSSKRRSFKKVGNYYTSLNPKLTYRLKLQPPKTHKNVTVAVVVVIPCIEDD